MPAVAVTYDDPAMGGSDDVDDRTRSMPRDPDADTVVQRPGRAGASDALHERLARGALLGRYVVEEQIGEGGMGVVYAANDPELHRRVALKLLQPELGSGAHASDGRARLLREAQAMAQLSHPNVIHVYDVGTFEDHVFLALEFIDGEHLGRWIRRELWPWREVVRVFIAAGRGLAAAHAAGLVHRDFKPDNVLIGKDGRVLVMDFGLARAEADPLDDESSPKPSSRGSQPLLAPLTEVGVVMGTPGYAAPEHLTGVPGDARSDQFSFAASLYACLYRKRPYDARSFAEYRKMLDAGSGFPEPPPSAVPAWVRRTIERGLSLDPAARFPSMDALLDALTADPAVRRRRWLIAGTVVAALAIGAGATVRAIAKADDNRALLCTGADRKLAGVWDDARRQAMKHAFLASERPYKQIAFDGAAKRLDDRARAWTAMHTESCEATRLHGEQPESVMTLRTACLDQRLRELGQLVDVFVAADGKVVERAIAATSALSPLDPCADVKALTAAVSPPANLATRAAVDQLRQTLARSKALFDGGKFQEAADTARPVVAAARQLGYRPIEAEALIRLGETQVWLQPGQPAVDTLRAAARAGEASHYDEIRARALAWIVGVIGFDLEKPADALVLADDARAAIERLGGDPYIQSILESSLGRTYSRTNDFAKMLEHHNNSLAIRRKLFGEDDPNTANAYNNVAVALKELGRYREALATHKRAQDIRERVLGPDHPDSAMSMANVGSEYYELGDLDEALANTDAALTAARRSLPATHPIILTALTNKAVVLSMLGRYPESQATYDELFATARGTRRARVLTDHAARLLVPTGHAEAALAEATEARKIYLESSGKPDDEVAFAMEAQGAALAALGKLDAALATFHEAIDVDDKALGPDDPKILDLLDGVAKVELAKQRPGEAAAQLERAIAICERHGIGGVWRARYERELAAARHAATAGGPPR
jgi:tetratricopeptide (TPR) repeat protein/predicted Ser/Thr protein kinase